MRRHRYTSRVLLVVSVVIAAAVSVPLTSAQAADPRVVVAHASPLRAGDTPTRTTGAVDFALGLSSRDPAGLATFLRDVRNAESPLFHHFLTAAEFRQRFGASPEAIASVRSYFASYGIATTHVSRGGTIITMAGPTRDIAHALQARVVMVRHSTGALAGQLRSRATLPHSIAQYVSGLSGLSGLVMHSRALARTTTPTPSGGCASTLSPSSSAATTTVADGGTVPTTITNNEGFTVTQQAVLYGFDHQYLAGYDGTGVPIGIYELGGAKTSDLTTFFACYGLGDATANGRITYQNVDGGPTGATVDEATLDIEQAAALAPGSPIVVYQGPNNTAGPLDVYGAIADDSTDASPGPAVISVSWGLCENDPSSSVQAEAPVFSQIAAEGKTLIAASGDAGSSDCGASYGLNVDDPSSQPLVTGVGGVSVNTIVPLSQSAWGANQAGGGGGFSSFWSRPDWQQAWGITSTTGVQDNTPMRLVPDLSVMADPNTGFVGYLTSTNPHGWSGIGGTSIGSPIVSAMVAVTIQGCNIGYFGSINPALYAMALTSSTDTTSGFRDVTTGSNNVANVGGYNAGLGYDMATGLGTPNPNTFYSLLCARITDWLANPTPTTTSTTSSTTTSTTPTTVIQRPGSATITTLSGIAGGFSVTIRPPSASSGSATLRYQYSVKAGTWVNFSGTFASAATVTLRVSTLLHRHTYYVQIRAKNTAGAGPASAAKRVVTK